MQIGQDGWQSSYSKVHICLQPLTFKGLLNSMLCHKPLAHKMDNKASLNISPWVTTRWEDNWEFTVWLTWAVLVAVNKCVWMSVYMWVLCASKHTLCVIFSSSLFKCGLAACFHQPHICFNQIGVALFNGSIYTCFQLHSERLFPCWIFPVFPRQPFFWVLEYRFQYTQSSVSTFYWPVCRVTIVDCILIYRLMS